MRVLGVDPGTVATGWGVIDEVDRRLTYVAGGVIRARGPLSQRLARIYEQAQRVLSEFAPHCVSLEKTFVGENVQSAFRLGEARGAILVAAAQAGVPVTEYSPAEIKVAVAGNGRAAKEQMQIMVGHLLALRTVLAGDEADALGAAICHLHTHSFMSRITPAVSRKAR
jgi:crossover junction endodeoxyribonuclease RuvC